MEIYNSIEAFETTGYESHVALGFFDGVHLGHRAVIADSIAGKGACRSVVLTFAESPAKQMGKEGVRLITGNEEKAALIEALGVDTVIFADFLSLRDKEPEEFVEEVLCRRLRAKKVSCGYNYRFGNRGAGDTALLRRLCEAHGIAVSVTQPVACGGRTVSSSAIRELLQSGGIEEANRMLGAAFAVCGEIGSGNRLGSVMGYPTVNLPIGADRVVPRYGVYASQVTVGGKTYRGATNIGVHPTVGENDTPLCETFLLDYRGEELYGEKARCELLRFLRPEQKFASGEELTAQIGRDIETIKQM